MSLKIIHQITSTIQRFAKFVNYLWIIFRFIWVRMTFFRVEPEFAEKYPAAGVGNRDLEVAPTKGWCAVHTLQLLNRDREVDPTGGNRLISVCSFGIVLARGAHFIDGYRKGLLRWNLKLGNVICTSRIEIPQPIAGNQTFTSSSEALNLRG